MIRILLAFIVWFFAAEAAIKYGSIWQSQITPMPNVQVQWENGSVEVGSLQRNWSGDWIFLKDDGSISNLKSLSNVILTTQPPIEKRGYWTLWRQWLPITLISFLAVAFILYSGSKNFREIFSKAIKKQSELKIDG